MASIYSNLTCYWYLWCHWYHWCLLLCYLQAHASDKEVQSGSREAADSDLLAPEPMETEAEREDMLASQPRPPPPDPHSFFATGSLHLLQTTMVGRTVLCMWSIDMTVCVCALNTGTAYTLYVCVGCRMKRH